MALRDFDDYADLHEGVTGDTIRAAADDPNENANVIAALASELAEDEQRVAADVEGDISAGTRTNPAQAQLAASQLAQAGYYAVGLLKQFAADVDTFDAGVEDLNRRLRGDTASAQRYAGQAAAHTDEEPPEFEDTWNNVRATLEPEYRDLDDALEESADSIASKFEAGPTEANVRALVLAGLIPMSVASAQWPHLTFSARERFDAYQAAVANGTLSPIEEMTEAERQAFLQDNPGILEDWMEISDPPPEVQQAIVALALPGVDPGDASTDVQTILDGIEGDATAEEIRAAFADSGEIASGLALLLPWAGRNGVDLSDSRFDGRATNAQAYSEEFGRQTWEHREDIETLLTDGVAHEVEGTGAMGHKTTRTEWESLFTEAEAEELRSQWAGSYLVASNEDIGGGWDALPDDMRYDLSLQQSLTDTGKEPRFVDVASFLDKADADLPAGDGLSLELANSASTLLDAHYSYGSSGPGPSDPGWHNGPNEELYGSLLERASLNHEATTYLLGGDPGWDMDDVHVPEDFDHSEFITNVYTHPWEDGGEAASALTDWTIDPPAGSEDLADSAYNGLYDTIAGNQDVYSQLITLDGGPHEGGGVGEANPELMRSLALATGERLDQFDTNTDQAGERQRVKMFMLINTDHAQTEGGTPDPNSGAVRLATVIEGYQQQRIADSLDPDHSYPDGDPHQQGTVGEQNGRLFAYNSAALDNVIYSSYTSDQEAAQEVAETRQMAISILGTVPLGDAGPIGSIATILARESIEPEDVPLPETIDPGITGSSIDIQTASPAGLTSIARAQYLENMIALDPSLGSQYEDLGIINPDSGRVDLSNVPLDQVDHINSELEQRMSPEVNNEIADLLAERDAIVGQLRDDLSTEEFTGR